MADESEPPAAHVEFEGLSRAYGLYDSGINHRLAGNYPLSLSELREAKQIFHLHGQEKSPMEVYAAYELARTADEVGSYDLARRSYEECTNLDMRFLLARLHLAKLEAKRGDFSAALKEARAAIAVEPNSAEAHFIVAILLEKTGSSAEASVEKQKAIDLTKNVPSAATANPVMPYQPSIPASTPSLPKAGETESQETAD